MVSRWPLCPFDPLRKPFASKVVFYIVHIRNDWGSTLISIVVASTFLGMYLVHGVTTSIFSFSFFSKSSMFSKAFMYHQRNGRWCSAFLVYHVAFECFSSASLDFRSLVTRCALEHHTNSFKHLYVAMLSNKRLEEECNESFELRDSTLESL